MVPGGRPVPVVHFDCNTVHSIAVETGSQPLPLQAFWPLQAFRVDLQALWPLQALMPLQSLEAIPCPVGLMGVCAFAMVNALAANTAAAVAMMVFVCMILPLDVPPNRHFCHAGEEVCTGMRNHSICNKGKKMTGAPLARDARMLWPAERVDRPYQKGPPPMAGTPAEASAAASAAITNYCEAVAMIRPAIFFVFDRSLQTQRGRHRLLGAPAHFRRPRASVRPSGLRRSAHGDAV